MEAVQTHAPFVMRGRARRDDAFGSAMRALGDDATLRKVAPSSVVDVREHSVRLRDGGRLYATQTRSMRVEEASSNRDRHIVTASCDALGEAASALSRTAPDFHLGPCATELRLYPADGASRRLDICGGNRCVLCRVVCIKVRATFVGAGAAFIGGRFTQGRRRARRRRARSVRW